MGVCSACLGDRQLEKDKNNVQQKLNEENQSLVENIQLQDVQSDSQRNLENEKAKQKLDQEKKSQKEKVNLEQSIFQRKEYLQSLVVSNASQDPQYQGTYQAGKRHGKGIQIFENGDIYNGQWNNDEMEGFGFFIWKNEGKQYTGEFKNNNPHGFGVMTLKDQWRFEGFFEQGQKNGNGVIVDRNGQRTKAVWQMGKLIK